MLALVIVVPAAEVELASDVLWSLGVLAIEERASGGDRIVSTNDRLVELWTALGDDAIIVSRAAEAFPARWRWRIEEVDATIADLWRAHATITWVDADLIVCPAWIDPPSVAGHVTVISIEPGASFGLGDHPTTVLTLRALRQSLFRGATVLDVGCGSGVLAVAACRLGAARAEAIDIAAAAVEATAANADRNGVGGMVTARQVDLDAVEGTFDIVLANISAPTLIELASGLRRVCAPAGVLVISGVLAEHHDHVLDALAPLLPIETSVRDGWAAVTLRS